MNIVLVAINAKFIHSCLAVYSLYAYLGEEKKHVQIREFTVNQREELIVSELFAMRPDVLAFSCYIWNIDMVLSIAETFKKIAPEVKIVAGGPEVSYGFKSPDADIIVSGEGEAAFSELVRGFLSGKPLRKTYKSKANLPLEDIPFPYQNGFVGFKNRIIYYETARGCTNQCGYCLSSANEGVRFLPMERVQEDLAVFLREKVRQVKLVDRTFNCNKQHTMEIWKYLIQNDNGITNFHFELAADLLDDEMVSVIKRAGAKLFQFEIGVQSTNFDTLSAIRRKTDIRRLLDNVRKLKMSGNVNLHLDLIAGLPFEDHSSFISSFNDVIACFPDQLQVGFLKLLKGSALRKDAAKYGIKFKSSPPYEILANNFMGYEVINRLKKIEHMVELFYNSGGFRSYMLYMAPDYDFFEALSVYWEKKDYHLASHKKAVLYTVLYEFGGKSRIISELLKFDMLTLENIRTFPNWINEYYSFDWKKITKTNALHTFEYDIPAWLNEIKTNTRAILQKKETEVLFDY